MRVVAWLCGDRPLNEFGVQVGHADAHSVALLGLLDVLSEHLQTLHLLLHL